MDYSNWFHWDWQHAGEESPETVFALSFIQPPYKILFSFIYTCTIVCPPKKSSCFPSLKAAAIDPLQTQGLEAGLPQHCRAVLEKDHPLWRGRLRISQACKGDPPRVQHRKCLDECCCQMHAHFRIFLSSSFYRCKFLPHVSHLHLLSGKEMSVQCWALLSTTCEIVAPTKSTPHHSG